MISTYVCMYMPNIYDLSYVVKYNIIILLSGFLAYCSKHVSNLTYVRTKIDIST